LCLLAGVDLFAAVEVEERSVFTEYKRTPVGTSAQPSDPSLSVDERLSRLENLVEAQKNQNIETRLLELEDEIRKLRGEVELQSKALSSVTRERVAPVNTPVGGAPVEAPLPGIGIGHTASPLPALEPAPESSPLSLQQAPKATPSALQGFSDAEQRLYTRAYASIKSKHYDEALSVLEQYTTTYPEGYYVGNAVYWKAEIYLLQSRYADSYAQFDRFIKRYPTHVKVPDALFKEGLLALYQKKESEAKRAFKKVVRLYPTSKVASQARQQLLDLKD
jgi:tol-pal system protein YbgF